LYVVYKVAASKDDEGKQADNVRENSTSICFPIKEVEYPLAQAQITSHTKAQHGKGSLIHVWIFPYSLLTFQALF